MKKFVNTCSETKCLFVSGFIFIMLCILANTVWRQDFVYLTQTYRYSAQTAYALLDTIGESGRDAHLKILFADTFMVFAYTIFLIGFNYRMSCHITKNCHFITIVTFAVLSLSIVQILEIVTVAIMIQNASYQFTNLAHLASTLTAYKFYLTPVCYGLPIVLLSVKIIKRYLTKPQENGKENSERKCSTSM